MLNVYRALRKSISQATPAASLMLITVMASGCGGCSGNSGAAGDAISAAAAGGGAAATPAPTVVPGSPAVASAISPNRGYSGGGTQITITGTNFSNDASVTVGGADCKPVVYTSSTQISCTTAAGTDGSSADVVVTNSGAPASSPLASAFTYQSAPTISSYTPSAGALAGGTPVTLTGYAFNKNGSVTVGGAACSPLTVSNDQTSATCTIQSPGPNGGAGGAASVIADNGGGSAPTTAGTTFTAQAAPVLNSISPTHGTPSGGNTIVLTGTGFLANATVSVGGKNCPVTSTSSTTSISCTAPNGSAGSAVAVVVTNTDNQPSTDVVNYTYNAAPTITSITEASGSAMGGMTIHIVGTHFLPNPTSVTLGGTACTSFAYVSASSITCVTPGGTAATGLTASVTNSDGQSASGGTYDYQSVMFVAQSSNTSWIGGLINSLGALTGTSGSIDTATSASAIATHPTKRKVYMAYTGSVENYDMDGAGSLTPVSVGATLSSGYNAANSLVVAPNGNFALLSNSGGTTGTSKIIPFPIDGSGNLTAAGTAVGATLGGTAQKAPQGLAIDSGSAHAYVAFESTSSVCSYNTNTTSGALTSAACQSGPSNANSVAIGTTGSGTFLYAVGGGLNSQLWEFPISAVNGTLGSPTKIDLTTTSGADSLAVVGNLLYVGNGDGTLGYSKINSDGSLTAQTSYAVSGTSPAITGIASDPSSKYLYVADNTNNVIHTYTINATDGSLTETLATFAGAGLNGPLGIVFSAK